MKYFKLIWLITTGRLSIDTKNGPEERRRQQLPRARLDQRTRLVV